MPEPGSIPAHLLVLSAAARRAGSEAEAVAREYCRGHLARSGFSVSEEPFEFSAAVGQFGATVAGLCLAASFAAIATITRVGAASFAEAQALLIVLLVVVALVGMIATRYGVLSFPAGRRTSTNLVAVRGEPRVWLFAHLDTKSQPISILLRSGAVVVLLAAVVVTLVSLAMAWPAGAEIALWTGTAAALVLSAAIVGNDSPGAADNASGVATVLGVAERVPVDTALGIVLTSAEELALAGSRAWARRRRRSNDVAINVDTVDDVGSVRCMTHGYRYRRLSDSLRRSFAAQGAVLRVHPLIPGILTDGVALADAGWPAVTLTRGSIATLARIHRPADSVEQITGTGASELAELLAAYIAQQD